jgi:hypothetical protein
MSFIHDKICYAGEFFRRIPNLSANKQSAERGGLFTNGSNDRLYEKRTYFSKRDRYCPYPSSSSFSTGMNRMAAEFMQ